MNSPAVPGSILRSATHVTANRYRFCACLFLSAISVCFAAAPSFPQRLPLTPRLRTGQILFYQIDFNGSRNMKTESRVTSPQMPPTANLNASALLQVEVLEANASGLHLKTYYSERNSSAQSPGPRNNQNLDSAAPDKIIEVSIAPNGAASRIKGFDQLSTAEQFTWNDWLSRFTSSMSYPKTGVRAGQKWQRDEAESAASPIAALSWKANYEYVRDEPCAFRGSAAKSTPEKSPALPQTCAIVFVRSELRQKSSPKNSTPEDYKLRNLKTRGTATGKNETILYISRSTGLLVRSTEDAQQAMNMLVALADGSNEVHYTLDAKSHSEISLLPDSP